MISFRQLSLDDMPQMYIWHNTDFVKRWWKFADYSTIEVVTNEYNHRLEGNSERNYIITCNGVDIGYIQTCMTSAYPPYREHLKSEELERSSCIDMFIGNKDYIHKGYGVTIIKEFLKKYIFDNSEVDKCIIDLSTNLN